MSLPSTVGCEHWEHHHSGGIVSDGIERGCDLCGTWWISVAVDDHGLPDPHWRCTSCCTPPCPRCLGLA